MPCFSVAAVYSGEQNGSNQMVLFPNFMFGNNIQGKRTAQSGTYPWPPAAAGTVVEVSEKEFEYLLSKSVVPFKEKKKCCDS